jgi:hypothetical protein
MRTRAEKPPKKFGERLQEYYNDVIETDGADSSSAAQLDNGKPGNSKICWELNTRCLLDPNKLAIKNHQVP